MISDKDILLAVQRTRDKWESSLEARDVEELSRWLDEAASDDPEEVRLVTNRVLVLLQRHPQAHIEVRHELGVREIETLRVYEPSPGSEGEVPAGTLVVCPEDPSHCRKRLRQKGQVLFCSEHGVRLVPSDSIPSEE